MASLESEKPSAAYGTGYVPVPNSPEDDGDGAPTPGSHSGCEKGSRTGRSRFAWIVACCLAILALLLALSAGSSVHSCIRCSRVKARDVDDIFDNWGKPGTGTEKLAWYPTDFLRDVVPVPCHSHNDYWRKVPLFSAIHAGCIGVEADVWLLRGDLLVGHDTAALQPDRTFKSLYVNPLVELLERNNPTTDFYSGSRRGIFDTDPEQTLVLLVDLKTDGKETWPWVMRQLEPLREKGWLSYFTDGKFNKRPITVVGTGNTPFDQVVANVTYRDAFFDAPLDKLENTSYDWTNSYYASTSLWQSIGNIFFRGGEPSPEQLAKIRAHVREARARGLHSRYWELPAWPIHVRNRIWTVLVEEGVDLLNVDDLNAATKGDWTKPTHFT